MRPPDVESAGPAGPAVAAGQSVGPSGKSRLRRPPGPPCGVTCEFGHGLTCVARRRHAGTHRCPECTQTAERRMIEKTFTIRADTSAFVRSYASQSLSAWLRNAIAEEIDSTKALPGWYASTDSRERPRGRPELHGEGRGEKIRVRLSEGVVEQLEGIAKRDAVSTSVIVQHALEKAQARVNFQLTVTLRAIVERSAFANARASWYHDIGIRAARPTP
jgi:predicted transcriptional regulator